MRENFQKRVLTHLGAEVQSVYSIICNKMNVHFAQKFPKRRVHSAAGLADVAHTQRCMQTIQLGDGWLVWGPGYPRIQGSKEPGS